MWSSQRSTGQAVWWSSVSPPSTLLTIAHTLSLEREGYGYIRKGCRGYDDSYHQRMWRRSLSIDSSFCRAVVGAGYLSWQQMLDATCRYRLGAIRRNAVIFWQINQKEEVCNGKVMYYGPDCHRRTDEGSQTTWVSALLARRHGGKFGDITRHCLFGLHLLNPANSWMLEPWPDMATGNTETAAAQTTLQPDELPPVAVVEAEKTAVILSARYPQYIWLATGGLYETQPEKFRPLKGRKVILFPDADPEGKAYNYWYQAAQAVMAQPYWEGSPPIRVSALLEQQATADQKRRKIDLVEFITESL